ncbi:MAG: DUF4239 domain-containing protein [Streptosporangiales bacterium]|nr:DUF4239 domain-containing protein [Streptosporangiales bacterium]
MTDRPAFGPMADEPMAGRPVAAGEQTVGEGETVDERRSPSVLGFGVLLVLMAATFGVVMNLRETYELATWVEAAFLIAIGVGVAHLGLSVVWWIYPPDKEDNDAVEAAFATVAAIFALLFGFVIVVVWEGYSETQTAVSREADAIAELTQMSHGFGADTRNRVEAGAATYLERVVEEEWPKLDSGDKSAKAERALTELWSVYTEMSVKDRANPLYGQSVSRLNELGDARRARLDAAAGSDVPALLWVMLCVGAALTVFVAYLYRVSSMILQRILITLMAGVMVFALFLIAALDRPFDERLQIGPENLQTVQRALR